MIRTVNKLAFFLVNVLVMFLLHADEAPDYNFIQVAKPKMKASSILVEPGKDKDKYIPDKAIDGEKDTSWCEGKSDDGIGEWIEARWIPTLIEGFQIGNGVLLSRSYHNLNNRIKNYELTIFLSNGKKK